MILIRTKKVHKPHNYFPDYHGILVDYLIVIWKKKKKSYVLHIHDTTTDLQQNYILTNAN